jgi:S1-C subfamily serine protease
MRKTISLLALALTFAFTAAAFAGGEQCAQEHAARKAKLAAHGWLGIETDHTAATPTVTAVAAGSPAEKAGFQKGDVLLALNGVPMRADHHDQLMAAKADCKVGKTVTYTIQRNGAQQTLTATLAAIPETVLAQWMAEDEKSEKVAKNDH